MAFGYVNICIFHGVQSRWQPPVSRLKAFQGNLRQCAMDEVLPSGHRPQALLFRRSTSKRRGTDAAISCTSFSAVPFSSFSIRGPIFLFKCPAQLWESMDIRWWIRSFVYMSLFVGCFRKVLPQDRELSQDPACSSAQLRHMNEFEL